MLSANLRIFMYCPNDNCLLAFRILSGIISGHTIFTYLIDNSNFLWFEFMFKEIKKSGGDGKIEQDIICST